MSNKKYPWDARRPADRHLNAYYYSFRPTGVPEIDNILAAVAYAGKMYHNTDQWYDTGDDDDETSVADWIQEAADDAAKELGGGVKMCHPQEHHED